jgi:2-polyprenyl-3-methyl-5-hydroxy-6-metoxy-1,4-benzoquinol methylase
MRSPIPLRFRLYRPPPPSVYDAMDGEYLGRSSSYAAYNYLGGGPVSHVKSAHFEAALEEAAPLFGDAAVIDFGCADGVFVPSLARHFGSVLAIDQREDFVARTRQVVDACGLSNVEVLCNAGTSMEELAGRLRPRGFRAAFLLETLEHIADPADLYGSRAAFVERLLDLLRDDGVVIVTVPTMVGPAFAVQRAVLAACGMQRESLSRKELFDAVVRRRTDALEPRWNPWAHLGFNHLKLERALAGRLRIVEHRNLVFSQLYVVARRDGDGTSA